MHLKKRPIGSAGGVGGVREWEGTPQKVGCTPALSTLAPTVEWNRIGAIPGVWAYLEADHGSQNGLLQAIRRKGSGRWWSPRKIMFVCLFIYFLFPCFSISGRGAIGRKWDKES